MPLIGRSAIFAVASALSLAAPDARADDPVPAGRCTEAYVDGQHRLRAGRLLEAAEALLVCARDPCSHVLQPECARWLAEAQTRTPSIVLDLRDARGEPVTEASVTLDAAPWSDALSGRAHDVDPGEHVIAATRGGRTVERRVLVPEATKARSVSLVLPEASPPRETAPIPLPIPAPASSPPRASRVPPLAWALGGLGAAALGVFAGFSIGGLAIRNDLETCRPGCDPARVDALKRDWVAADVSFGVAAVALGLAAWTWMRAEPTAAASRW